MIMNRVSSLERRLPADRSALYVAAAFVLGLIAWLISLGYDNSALRAAGVVATVGAILTAIIAAAGAWMPHSVRTNTGRREAIILAGLAVLAVVALLLPFFVSDFRIFQFTLAIQYMIAVLGLNILTGYSGQISLGHSAFFAIGGYTTAIMMNEWGVDWYLTIPVAGILAGLAGFLFGIPALRLQGLYLALATLALGIVVAPVLKKFDEYTGGSQGISLFGAVDPWFGNKDEFFYYISLAVGAVLFLVAWNLVRGRFGRALIALRDSETAAISMGVNVALYKTTAFGISAFYAGIAGAFYGLSIGFVSPDQYSILLAIRFLVGTVVGGLASIEGNVFGGLFLQFMPNYVQDISQQAPDAIFAIVLILLMYVMPTGIAGYIRRAWRWGSRHAPEPVPVVVPEATAPTAPPAGPTADADGHRLT
jgi:branched-chain amino acid transport system permease protein